MTPPTTKEKIMDYLFDTNLRWGFIHTKTKQRFPISADENDEYQSAINKLDKLLDQIREETTHQCYQDIDKLLIKKGLEDFAILREERDKAVKESTHQCYQEIREKAENLRLKTAVGYRPKELKGLSAANCYNQALSDVLQLIKSMEGK